MHKMMKVKNFQSLSQLVRYLPSNYTITAVDNGSEPYAIVEGEDVAGWTAQGYVIPRLASGNIIASPLNF